MLLVQYIGVRLVTGIPRQHVENPPDTGTWCRFRKNGSTADSRVGRLDGIRTVGGRQGQSVEAFLEINAVMVPCLTRGLKYEVSTIQVADDQVPHQYV